MNVSEKDVRLIKTSLAWILSVLSLYLETQMEEFRKHPIPIGDKNWATERAEALKFFHGMQVSGQNLFNELQPEEEDGE
jgi:hypothetical protein